VERQSVRAVERRRAAALEYSGHERFAAGPWHASGVLWSSAIAVASSVLSPAGTGALHAEGFAKGRQHCTVLVEAQLFLDGDLDLEPEDPQEKLAQLPAPRFADERIEVASFSNDAPHVQRAVTGGEKMVALAREQLGGGFTTELGSDTIARLELTQSAEEPSNVPRVASVNDVEVECRYRGTLDHGRNPSHQDETNPMTAKSREEGGEVTWRARHGEAL
jgi:hypothetical protein